MFFSSVEIIITSSLTLLVLITTNEGVQTKFWLNTEWWYLFHQIAVMLSKDTYLSVWAVHFCFVRNQGQANFTFIFN